MAEVAGAVSEITGTGGAPGVSVAGRGGGGD